MADIIDKKKTIKEEEQTGKENSQPKKTKRKKDSWPQIPPKPLKQTKMKNNPGKTAETEFLLQEKDLPEIIEIPMIPIMNMVVFPGVSAAFDVTRESQKLVIKQAWEKDGYLFIGSIKPGKKNRIDPTDICDTGSIVMLRQTTELPTGNGFKVLVEGVSRAQVNEYVRKEPYAIVKAKKVISSGNEGDTAKEAQKRDLIRAMEGYAALSGKIQPDFFDTLHGIDNLSLLVDMIAANIPIPFEKRFLFLETYNASERAILLRDFLEEETQIMFYERELGDKVRSQIDKTQKEYYVREQIRILREEVGDKADFTGEAERYLQQLQKLKVIEETRTKIEKEIKRLDVQQQGSPEISYIRNYLDLFFDLPWGKTTKENLSIAKARKILDQDHYGMEKVKERILEFIAVRKLKTDQNISDIKGPILCLVGPPGTGKTSIAKSLSRAMGRKYIRMSLGGVHDESEIRGHRRTYIGSLPGRFISAIKQAKTDNPLILLDEVDKIGKDFRGDPASALLEVLDPEQNNNFRDNYLEVPYDLSKVLFITTANLYETIPSALLDRMEVVNLSGYTQEEKTQIAIKHIIPKQLRDHGLDRKKLIFTKSAVLEIIQEYTEEAGVRDLERKISKVCRKSAIEFSENNVQRLTIKVADLHRYLGHGNKPDSFSFSEAQIGVVNGLAWTAFGGKLLPIEVSLMEGSGKLELTGQLGEVMKESAKLAYTYTRSNFQTLGLEKEFYKDKDIHIHVPAGATPKEGPSAGIALTMALISAVTGKAVSNKMAMTGEITLRGKVLVVGGIKEKLIAADRFGMKKVLIPYDNAVDIEELPESVRNNLQIVPVKTLDEVIAETESM
jgi:ATP-dependent Lon protease